MTRNHNTTVNRASPARVNAQTTTSVSSSWYFGIPVFGPILQYLTGSQNRPGGKSSRCAKELSHLAKKYPEHADSIKPIGRLVELEDSADDIKSIAISQKKRFETLKDTLNLSSKEIGQLRIENSQVIERAVKAETQLEVARTEAESLEESIANLASPVVRKELPILWGQSLDLVSKKMPAVLRIMGNAGALGRLHPSEDSDAICILDKVATQEVSWAHKVEATFLLAAKQERGMARDSEDRIGFMPHESGYRAIALDGVGGSMHPRHLVRELGEGSLDADDLQASIRDTLRVVGEGMVEDKVMVAPDDKLAFFQKKRLDGGAACVLAAVDYASKNKRATVHQIGDTVAFVQLPRGKWEIVPKALSDGKSFDSRPEQLNCKDPSSASQIDTVEVAKATGVIALATDGVAEHILLNGDIGKFIERVRKSDGEGTSLIHELRSEGIADDDLSFLLIEPQ